MHDPHANLADFDLAQRCLDGDEQALTTLLNTYKSQILAYLMKTGASLADAEEVVEQLWADAVVAAPEKSPRLAHYDGSCKLGTWLNTVAMNRLISAKRKQQREARVIVAEEPNRRDDEDGSDRIEPLGITPALAPEDLPLIELLRGGIEAAFARCSAENFVLLQLAYGDGLRVAELGQIWGCNPGTISRWLRQASEEVERLALAHVRATDPYLEITWSDFLLLCRTSSLGVLGFE
ncbi:RNA polymerase sigma factor [Verrucomicrobiota bacterium sgz303538]